MYFITNVHSPLSAILDHRRSSCVSYATFPMQKMQDNTDTPYEILVLLLTTAVPVLIKCLYNVYSMINENENMTGAFRKLSTEINDDFRKLPIYRCCKKRIAVRIVFSQNRNIPIYRLYRPPLPSGP